MAYEDEQLHKKHINLQIKSIVLRDTSEPPPKFKRPLDIEESTNKANNHFIQEAVKQKNIQGIS